MDTPRPTRPGIGNGIRWADLEATLKRVDNAINGELIGGRTNELHGVTSRDGHIRVMHPGETPVPGDLLPDGRVTADGTLQPYPEDAIAHVDNVIDDLDAGHPDSAQVAADMRAAIADTTPDVDETALPSVILTVDAVLSTEELDALRERFQAEMAAHIGFYETAFDRPPTPPLTYEQLLDNIRQLGPLDPPPAPIQLTDEQFDQLPKAPPRKPWELDPGLFGTPVHRVDTVEESTPYRLERARHIEEQHVELCGCNWDHPANVQPERPGWLRRAIRRIFG